MTSSVASSPLANFADFNLFLDPPADFSPAPIWWWSGEQLDPARLRWQLEQFAAGGVFNLIILNLAPTGPLYGSDPDDPHFLTEEWWAIFTQVCRDAQELGVRLWFYDQIGFSGANFQGVVVRNDATAAGQWLDVVTVEGNDTLRAVCPSDGVPLTAAVQALDPAGEAAGPWEPVPIQGHAAAHQATEPRRLRLVYAVHRGFDYFSPDACRRLLDMVHGEFERRVGHHFGSVIVGSFQDELPSLATWGSTLADEFRRRRGYDLVPFLPALWDEGADQGQLHQVRVDYHRTRAELAEEAFFRPLHEWHQRHGLLCGFDQQGPARAGHPLASVDFYADYLATHRWFTAPGSDHHGEAKIHSSLAHLYDRPRTWIESFHSTGWGGTLEETFDWLLPWLRAGANLYNPHAVYYSTRGGWWEWAPPSTCWRQPYWRHYREFARAVARLCYVLTRGHHQCRMALLYPTTTIQAGMKPDGQAVGGAPEAHQLYQELVGSMFWNHPQPGALDRSRRDYDILDDASLQRATMEAGAIHIGAESYAVIILPGCSVLAVESAARLNDFVEDGGFLIALGQVPQALVVSNTADTGETAAQETILARLQAHFAAGRAHLAADVSALPGLLDSTPPLVNAPVPTLLRRTDHQTILFVPAAFPAATQQVRIGNWLDVEYDFDTARYAGRMEITVQDVEGTPTLWDPFTGRRHTVKAVPTEDGMTVTVPSIGPAALLVWETETPATHHVTELIETETLTSAWESRLVPTMENRFGDFTLPAAPGAPPVQSWRFRQRVEAPGDDGLAAGWHHGADVDDWETVHATFALQAWRSAVAPADQLPAPLPAVPDEPSLQVAGWEPVHYSASRGIRNDPIHIPTLGPNGHVPEEFMALGVLEPGQGIQVRTAVLLDEPQDLHLAVGAAAVKYAWVNGTPVAVDAPGYLAQAPVSLRPGRNVLELRFVAEEPVNLRASWALVRDPVAYARPEWMTTADAPRQDAMVRFVQRRSLPFTPTEATIQVGADAPCRVLINGQEVGRQGGFDPYHTAVRVMPYATTALQTGENEIVLEVQEPGRPVAVVVDGLLTGPDGERLSWVSDAGWRVQREDEPPAPVRLRRRQWMDRTTESLLQVSIDIDPAFSHLWKRPHPLPETAWLEGPRNTDAVAPVQTDPLDGEPAVAWLSWLLPPGATEAVLPVNGQAQLWVDGVEAPLRDERATLPDPQAIRRRAVVRIRPDRGCTGGRLLRGPVTYTVEAGRMTTGLWADQGLESYAGGVRYSTELTMAANPPETLALDLGKVRGTAEVLVNGRSVGVRVLSPYRFEIGPALQSGANRIEILVFNTLAPYLGDTSPTHYVFPGQRDSGLLGPVRLLQAP